MVKKLWSKGPDSTKRGVNASEQQISAVNLPSADPARDTNSDDTTTPTSHLSPPHPSNHPKYSSDENGKPEVLGELSSECTSPNSNSKEFKSLPNGEATFGLTLADIDEFIQLYATRTAHEELDYISNIGGVEKLCKKINANPSTGICSEEDVLLRQSVFGVNRLPKKKRTSLFRYFWLALKDFILRILLLCGLISLILGVFGEHPEIEWVEGFAIWLAVFIVGIVTAGNDYAKEKQFEKLNMVKDDKKCSVIRNSIQQEISVYDLVVGDILTIAGGDEVPVDGIVLDSYSLRMDESSLTGESDQIKKFSYAICKEQLSSKDTPITNHRTIDSPVVLSGSNVAAGNATVVVLAVGVNSVLGSLFVKLGSSAEQTPLQNKLNALAHDIGKIGLSCAALALIILFVEFWIMWGIDPSVRMPALDTVRTLLDYAIVAITVVVVAVPEGLPLAVTISLAYSIGKMLKDQNYVRRLAACEIMGGANEICSDKTGTLTENKMSVQAFWNGNRLETELEENCSNLPPLFPQFYEIFIDGIVLNNVSYFERKPRPPTKFSKVLPDEIISIGSSTDCALLLLVERLGLDYKKIRAEKGTTEDIIYREPFSSERKMMSCVCKVENSEGKQVYRAHVKGASEKILSLCKWRIDSKGVVKFLEDEERKRIEKFIINQLASKALRTLCIAYRDFDPLVEKDWQEVDENGILNMEKNLVCLCVVGIRDPVRSSVPPAILQCQNAGINIRMITGDNLETAMQIAIKCKIYHPEANGLALLGADFIERVGGVICKECKTQVCDCPVFEEDVKPGGKKLRVDVLGNVEEFRRIAPRLEVMARSRPADKYALVVGLRNEGAVVAVTGDGTNDAPALKKADVGFAMGITGKEVAKQAADIVLLDDNFESIVKAVLWGRNIFSNIQRFLQFQLTVNVVAVVSTIIAVTLIRQSPFTAIQLLWVNLIMDSFASLALATEPPTLSLLKQKPNRREDYLISKEMFCHIIGQALYQLGVVFFILFYGPYFIPETTWSYLTEEQRVSNRFCEFGDCQDESCYTNCTGSYIRNGKQFGVFSSSEDYKADWIYTLGTSRHLTIVFNTFVLMQIVNLFAARKLSQGYNIFTNIHKNPMWISVVLFILLLQSIIVEYGSVVMSCHREGLTPYQWLICAGFALGTIPVFFLIQTLPKNFLPQAGKKEIEMGNEPVSIALASRGRFSRQRFSTAGLSGNFASGNISKQKFTSHDIRAMRSQNSKQLQSASGIKSPTSPENAV